ncbi:MAG TPA: alpha/beta hydrolase [Polyangia bacterium]|nr:alpha/beta hydrolase [Polyangia bacterium]
MHVRPSGPDDGQPRSTRPPVVYLPGAGGLASFWRPVAELLRPRSEPLLVEYPGFGETPPDPAVRGVSDLLDLVLGRLPSSFDLAAQSMGGALALRLALEHPARVRRLVLVATTGGIDVRRLGAAEWRTSEWVAQRPQMPRWFVDDRSDLGDRLPTLRVPTLVLIGDADPLAPLGVGEYLRNQIPRATLEIVEGGTHAMAEELPERIAALVDRHLA